MGIDLFFGRLVLTMSLSIVDRDDSRNKNINGPKNR